MTRFFPLSAPQVTDTWCCRGGALFDSFSVPQLISAGMQVSLVPSTSFIAGCFSNTTFFPLPPNHPLTHPLPSLFSPGTGLICGLRVQREIEGRRSGANWKEGGNMKGRSWREKEEESKSGRGGQDRKNVTE